MVSEVGGITRKGQLFGGGTTKGTAERSSRGNGSEFSRFGPEHEHPAGESGPIVIKRPSMVPDGGFLENCYARLLKLKAKSSDRVELRVGLEEILKDMAGHPDSYSSMVTSLLMRHWTEKKGSGQTAYDEHMHEHVEAIKCLIRAWAKNNYHHLRTIKIFDASCGTGKVLEAFLDCLPPELYPRIKVVANDVSSAARAVAEENLARFRGKVKIKFTPYDITRELPPGQFDIVILSQTLPFIVDDKTLRNQRLDRSNHQESSKSHLLAKRGVIEALIKHKLKPGSGELLLIDEDPMSLTKKNDDADSVIEDVLFGEVFRDIKRDELITQMKNIPSAKFMGHLESSIDRKHDMYLMVYQRNAKKAEDGVNRDSVEEEWMMVRAMEDMHPILSARLQGFDGDSVSYRPIGPLENKRLFIHPDYYNEKIDGKNVYWTKNGSYNLVVIKDLIHELDRETYRRLIENLKRSRKAEPGAALLFIDKWPKPQKANAMGNGDARGLFNDFPDHQFIASYRVGDTYGYLYLIRQNV
jgi:hypothetical protein